MGLFDKLTKTAANIGGEVAKAASNIGSNASVMAQEQSKLVALKSQINVIEQELN